MIMGLDGAQKTREGSRRLDKYSDKYKAGEQWHAFYSVFEKEEGGNTIGVGATWGYPIDPKRLGLPAIFVPANCIYDEAGNLKSQPDLLGQFNRIAKSFIVGQMNQEVAQKLTRKFDSEAEKIDAVQKIKDKYDTSKSFMKAIVPVVKGCKYQVVTELVFVKVVDGKIDPNSIFHVTQDISQKRGDKLMQLFRDSKSNSMIVDGYFEVEFNYGSDNDKSVLGQTLPEAVTEDYRLSVKDPEGFKAVQELINHLPKDSDMIMRRNSMFRTFEENEIKQAIMSYARSNAEYLENPDQDIEERLIKNVTILNEFGVIRKLQDEGLAEKLMKALEEAEKKAAGIAQAKAEEAKADADENGSATEEAAPQIEDMVKEADAPNFAGDTSLEALMQGEALVNSEEELLAEI